MKRVSKTISSSVPQTQQAVEKRAGSKWQKLSRQVRTEHPICQMCNNAISEVTDHITPVAEAPELMWVRGNLQALCRECHGKKHKES